MKINQKVMFLDDSFVYRYGWFVGHKDSLNGFVQTNDSIVEVLKSDLSKVAHIPIDSRIVVCPVVVPQISEPFIPSRIDSDYVPDSRPYWEIDRQEFNENKNGS